MALKYRVKVWSSLIDDSYGSKLKYYTAEYRIFGMWLYINKLQTGRFFKTTTCICETQEEAVERIKIHKKNMERASIFYEFKSTVVLNSKFIDDHL